MRSRIIKIGNSQGVRIPKALLEQSSLSEEVVLEAQPDQIIIRSAERPREGWDEAFRLMAQRGDDQLIDGRGSDGQSSWDEEEWQW